MEFAFVLEKLKIQSDTSSEEYEEEEGQAVVGEAEEE